MRLILTESHDPYYNLACEETYLRFSEDDVFMLWQNEPTVVIGKNQNYYAEVELKYTEANGIRVARRITGGGAVYHDLGNVNFTFITSKEKAHVLDFQYFTRPVVKALGELGIEAKLSGRNDLIAHVGDETENGETKGIWAKFSGNAMTATENRILLHGTLLFDSDLSVLARTLRPDEEKLRKRAIKSVRSRVTNLKPLLPEEKRSMTTEQFLSYLIAFIEREFSCKAETADRLSVIATGLYDRNTSEDYNAGRKKKYDREVRRRFESGLVVVLWNERESAMRDVLIEGDFFGDADVEALASRMNGVVPTVSGLSEALQEIDVSKYVSGVSNDAFLSLFG